MANQVEIKITADSKSAEAGIKKTQGGFGKMKESIGKHSVAIGVGVAAVGVGLEALAQSQAELTENTRKLAIQTGFSEDAIRGMATELSNATFPLESAIELMGIASQRGLEGEEALKNYANFWDTVGDATGLSAEKLAEAATGMEAVGIAAGDEQEALQAFGLVMQNGTGSVEDFIGMVGKLAPEMKELGLNVDDAAVFFAAMQEELGLTAKVAQAEFKIAMQQSTTGIEGVKDILGLTDEQLSKYADQLATSGGVVQDFADAHLSTKTPMDKLKSSMKDLVFQHGALIGVASQLAPIFMAAGPVIAGFNVIMGFMTPAVVAARTALIGLNLSMGPILLIVLGVAAAITAGILIWQNWDKVLNTLKATFGKIKDAYDSKFGWLLPGGALIRAIRFIRDNWRTIWTGMQTVFFAVVDSVTASFNGLVAIIKSGINSVIGHINTFIRGINSIQIKVPGVDIPLIGRVGGFAVGMPQIPEIPTLARGGIVNRPTLAMLGEAGPEAVVPLGRGGAGGITVNLTVNGNIQGMDDFEKTVKRVVRDAVLSGGFNGVLARA